MTTIWLIQRHNCDAADSAAVAVGGDWRRPVLLFFLLEHQSIASIDDDYN